MNSLPYHPDSSQPHSTDYERKQLYTVRYLNGYMLPSKQGSEITDHDIRTMIAGLTLTLAQVESGLSVSQIEALEESNVLDTLLASGSWFFGALAASMGYRPGIQKNHVTSCVYFLVSHSMPDVVKIGMTSDLFNRTKEHYQDWLYGEHKLIAVFCTPHYKAAERALHRHFRLSYKTNELYQRSTVEAFLRHIQGGEE